VEGSDLATTRTDSVIWNGTGWKVWQPASPGAPAWLDQVSCAPQFCLATGVGYSASDGGYLPIAVERNSERGTSNDVAPDLGVLCSGFSAGCGSWTSAVSCGSSTTCMTMGTGGDQFWNGQDWFSAPTKPAGPGSLLDAISCHRSMCMSVGYRRLNNIRHTLAELWINSAWQVINTPAVRS
jgi:hypothetical protein